MTNNKPLVSIIIPCYNHENYIQNSIQSVIDQDYKNIELIIIDDGSTDRSVDKIKEMSTYCEKRFENYVFIHRANKGVSATLNQGLSIAQGKYVSFCSSDDSYHPEKVSRQILFLQSNPKLNCCYTLICFVDEYSNIIESETELVNSKLNESISFEDILKFKINLPITGMFITKYIRDKLGGFDETLSAEDYDMNLKVAQESKVCFVKDRLYNYLSPRVDLVRRGRPEMRLDVSESHLKTLQNYIDHPAYKEALREWNYRRFVFFAVYSKTKYYSLCGMVKAIKLCYRPSYLKSFMKLIFIWKAY